MSKPSDTGWRQFVDVAGTSEELQILEQQNVRTRSSRKLPPQQQDPQHQRQQQQQQRQQQQQQQYPQQFESQHHPITPAEVGRNSFADVDIDKIFQDEFILRSQQTNPYNTLHQQQEQQQHHHGKQTTFEDTKLSTFEILSELKDDLAGLSSSSDDTVHHTSSGWIQHYNHSQDLSQNLDAKLPPNEKLPTKRGPSERELTSDASITSDIFDNDCSDDDEMDSESDESRQGNISQSQNEMSFEASNNDNTLDKHLHIRPTTTEKQRLDQQLDERANARFNVVASPNQHLKIDSIDDKNKSSTRFRGYQKDLWFERFKELKNYFQRHGDCLVPRTYKESPTLARWTKRQRYQYKQMKAGKASTMTSERIEMLEGLGFIWNPQSVHWEERLNELKEFRKVRGHCNVPSRDRDNEKLSVWVKIQRRQYKLFRAKKCSNITLERIDRLNQLGFRWEVRPPPSVNNDSASESKRP